MMDRLAHRTAWLTSAAPSFALFAKGWNAELLVYENWSVREDLNLRPPNPEAATEMLSMIRLAWLCVTDHGFTRFLEGN